MYSVHMVTYTGTLLIFTFESEREHYIVLNITSITYSYDVLNARLKCDSACKHKQICANVYTCIMNNSL